LAKSLRSFVKLDPVEKRALDRDAAAQGQKTSKQAAEIIKKGLEKGIK
jgi:hypothetical protein